jgi:hypothetical protein
MVLTLITLNSGYDPGGAFQIQRLSGQGRQPIDSEFSSEFNRARTTISTAAGRVVNAPPDFHRSLGSLMLLYDTYFISICSFVRSFVLSVVRLFVRLLS